MGIRPPSGGGEVFPVAQSESAVELRGRDLKVNFDVVSERPFSHPRGAREGAGRGWGRGQGAAGRSAP